MAAPGPYVEIVRHIETVHAEPHHIVDQPSYRVNFWQKSGGAWALDAHAFDDVDDVAEVLEWANNHSAGRRFELFVEIDTEPLGEFLTSRKAGLIRLLGSNPNAGESVEFGPFEKA